MPAELHEEIKKHIYQSHRESFSIVLEFGFYDQLSPKLQNQLTKQLFSKTINEFDEFFRGCDSSFVNRIIVSLSYKSFEDG